MANLLDLAIIIDYPEFSKLEEKLYKRIARAALKELDVMERAFKPAYRNWTEGSKPKWKKTFGSPVTFMSNAFSLGGFSFTRDEFAATMFTDSNPFKWVTAGTPRGFVAFSSGYRPMTRPGVLGSRARMGRVVARGRQAAPQTKGIRPRKFEFLVRDTRQVPFQVKIQKILDSEANKIFASAKRLQVIGSTA